MLTATSTANEGPEARLGEDQRREQPEAAVSGEVAAGEVAGGVEEDRGEEDPVEGFVAVEQAVLDRPAQRQGDDREGGREPELDCRSRPGSARRIGSPFARCSEMWRESSWSTGR